MVTGIEDSDGLLLPSPFFAVTEKVAVLPGVNPVNVAVSVTLSTFTS